MVPMANPVGILVLTLELGFGDASAFSAAVLLPVGVGNNTGCL